MSEKIGRQAKLKSEFFSPIWVKKNTKTARDAQSFENDFKLTKQSNVGLNLRKFDFRFTNN